MYSEQSDIENVIIPAAEIVMLCDDEAEGSANPKILGRVAAAISSADSEIDAVLFGICPLPFSPVPAIIKRISAKLAAWYLWARRSGEKPDNIVKEYNWAQSMLEKIRRRDIQVIPTAETTGGAPIVSKTADDRMFTDDVLRRMP